MISIYSNSSISDLKWSIFEPIGISHSLRGEGKKPFLIISPLSLSDYITQDNKSVHLKYLPEFGESESYFTFSIDSGVVLHEPVIINNRVIPVYEKIKKSYPKKELFDVENLFPGKDLIREGLRESSFDLGFYAEMIKDGRLKIEKGGILDKIFGIIRFSQTKILLEKIGL